MDRPKIGTGVWIRKHSKVLLGIRPSTVGHGTWGPPGGHLELNESMQECVIRETREEAGIEIQHITFITASENIWKEQGSHYVTLYFAADWKSGEPIPQIEEMEQWEWFDWNNLPKPLFRPAQIFVDTGINPCQ